MPARPRPIPRPGRIPFALLGLALLITSGCGREPKRTPPPKPPAAKVAVTTGVIVQLRLAVEAFDTVFDMRAEEQDLLPMLVHAWATFYGWTDPATDTRARYRFTEALCRARLPGQPEPRGLFHCMDTLRVALLQDLQWATARHLKRGHPDKVGSFSLKRLKKEIAGRLARLQQTLTARRQRRDRRRLHRVKQCRLQQPVAPVLGLTPRELSLNGFPVITGLDADRGRIADHELEGLRHQLESRLMESQPAGKQAEQLILAADRRVAGQTLWRIVGLAAGLGVSRVCLKVTRTGGFTVPCCLSVRLSPKVVRPRPALELDGAGLHQVTDAGRVRLGSESKVVRAAFDRLAHSGTAPPLVVLPGAAPARLYQTLQVLRGRVVELIPAGVPLTTRRPRPATLTPGGPRLPPTDATPRRPATAPTPRPRSKPRRAAPRQ